MRSGVLAELKPLCRQPQDNLAAMRADKALLDWLNDQALVIYTTRGRRITIDNDEDLRVVVRKAMERQP